MIVWNKALDSSIRFYTKTNSNEYILTDLIVSYWNKRTTHAHFYLTNLFSINNKD